MSLPEIDLNHERFCSGKKPEWQGIPQENRVAARSRPRKSDGNQRKQRRPRGPGFRENPLPLDLIFQPTVMLQGLGRFQVTT